jgi:hypothetical protein
MGQPTFFYCLLQFHFQYGILALERIQAQYKYIQCAKMFIPMSQFVCVEYVDTQDYLQATPVSEYFKMFSPKLANLKL